MPAAPLVLATRSAGKIRELTALLAEAGIAATSLAALGVPVDAAAEDALEVAATFEANALAKARHFAARLGRAVVADDSGLVVAALGGAPGVMSKRWSDRPDLSGAALDAANNALLLARLAGAPDRRARYVCAAAYVAGGREVVVRGEVAGEILPAPRGQGGFGYDPYFWSPELGATFGEATMAAKAAVSHRGRAIAALVAALPLG